MEWWKKSLPMWLTYSRIFFSITLFVSLWEEVPYRFLIAMGFFILGGLTDWLDGHWARRYNYESNHGKFMDTVTDKVFMLAAFLCLLDLGVISTLMIFIILSRDILIGGLRNMAAIQNIALSARKFGKWKTAIQMVAVPMIFFGKHFPVSPFVLIGYWMLWFSVALSLVSGFDYFIYYNRQSRLP